MTKSFQERYAPRLPIIKGEDFTGQTVTGSERTAYINCNFSHVTFKGDFCGSQFNDCIMYDSDFTDAKINSNTTFGYRFKRNPLEAKKHNGDYITKMTEEQRDIYNKWKGRD